jgi:putative FmdB family regulatory protein
MPIYEFYCDICNTIYSFFSRSAHTTKRPPCPKCRNRKLTRQMSTFAKIGNANAKDEVNSGDLPIDEAKMEKALDLLAREAEGMNDDDPRHAARLMRKFTDATGANLGPSMEEAMKRMEAGEDPDQIEAEMGDRIEGEEPFIFDGKTQIKGTRKRVTPRRDETLYDL